MIESRLIDRLYLSDCVDSIIDYTRMIDYSY
jgi:hypothetical protein